MKKTYSIAFIWLCILLVCGCTEKKHSDDKAIRIGILRGPSAIAFAEWMKEETQLSGKNIKVFLMDSPDQLVASYIQNKTDLAVLPMITAANLYNRGVDCRLLGCPIWGTLFIVERNAAKPNTRLLLFGAETTPGILARAWLEKNGSQYHPDFAFNNAREVMAALLAHRADAALLSEPFVSIALAKDSSLRIAADLNHLDGFDNGFAQTALICHTNMIAFSQSIDSLTASSCRSVNENPSATILTLERQHLFPKGSLTSESIARCKIEYRDAATCNESVISFLQLIMNYQPKAIGDKIPDDSFFKPTKR